MIRRRTTRALAALVASTTLAAAAFVVPMMALAGQPSWSVSVESLPDRVSNGETVGYQVEISNAGPSNISKLFLNAETPDGATFVAAIPSRGSCSAAGPLSCSLGALRKGQTTTVLAVYEAPDEGDSLTVDFEATTSGASKNDKGNSSHGDALVGTGTTELVSDPNFAGRFIFDASQLEVANDQAIGEGNQHATKVNAPQTMIPVTVEDTNDDAGCAEAELPCFGQTSEVHVAGGALFPDGFLVTVIFGPNELPLSAPGEFEVSFSSYEYDPSDPPEVEPFTADDLRVWHQLDNGTGMDVPRCDEGEGEVSSFDEAPADLPCFTAFDAEDGSIVAGIWTGENGNYRGY